ncbi:MAG: 1,4-alpha-glucan branching protein domain-containing protein [Armatimonadota bacterium]
MSSPPGAFCLVLHTHLPYVLGHSTWPHGTSMLYDAAAGCYLPLLRVFRRLVADGIMPKVTVSLTPIVVEQLADDRFKEWFPHYLVERIYMAEANAGEFRYRGDQHLAWLAERWEGHFRELQSLYVEELDRDIVGALRELQDRGAIEIMTSGATHGYLPLLYEDGSVQAQIRQGAQSHLRHFGRYPRGFWLPECAYRPRTAWAPPAEIQPPDGHTWWRKGIEEFLAENGLDYFIVDAHMLGGGDPLPVDIHGGETLGKLWARITRRPEPPRPGWEKTPYWAYFVGSHFEDHPPVACLVRHEGISSQVWSADFGYPGDGWYLEFHKKHLPGDHRYWRVTDNRNDLASKDAYSPEMAQWRVHEQAGHFVSMLHDTLEAQPRPYGRRPVICTPFDAELFGHWWHEGPAWLEQVIRWVHEDPCVQMMTGREYLADTPPATAITLPEGSWGAGGGHYIWLNDETAWSWRRIYQAERRMVHLARTHAGGTDDQLAAFVAQAARELLLLQASDWQFLISTGGAPDYAAHRLVAHHTDFNRVAELAERWARREYLHEDDWAYFGSLCARDRVFPDVEPDWWAEVHHPA